jgi:hypothetical protein
MWTLAMWPRRFSEIAPEIDESQRWASPVFTRFF